MSEERLEEIRSLSNVIQAIENLITQCETSGRFAILKLQLVDILHDTQQELLEKIHET